MSSASTLIVPLLSTDRVGVTMLAKEQRRLLVYEPVMATVLSTDVQEHSDSDGSTYEPVVVYRYRVQDREYTASRVTPLRLPGSSQPAMRIVAEAPGVGVIRTERAALRADAGSASVRGSPSARASSSARDKAPSSISGISSSMSVAAAAAPDRPVTFA